MINHVIEMIQNINDYQTTLGKVGLALDGVGIVLSVSFYGLGLGEFVNSIFPPIILVLTALSISTSLAFKIASEYRGWKKRREGK
jgi:xanthine/uracil permease